MAQRRMLSKTIIDTDAFMNMPLSTQCLYFHLALRADDDGFVSSPKMLQRMLNTAPDDLNVLVAKKFIIMFESGVLVIKHWNIHNYIQSDRYQPTSHLKEKSTLLLKDNGSYSLTSGQPIRVGYNMEAQVRLGKVSKGKDRNKAQLTKEDEERFERMWVEYPRKVAKKRCQQWWATHKPDEELTETIITSINLYKKTKQWRDGFIPHPATFLNQERWNDEVEVEKSTPSFKSYGK